jgi:murein DD-endopeptidase MepM/ murein hydrolase activator NlpD
VIAKVGSTGNSSGPHLHFEIRSGDKRLDPLKYLRQ